VGLERGPPSPVSTTEELLEEKVAASVWKTEITAVGMRRTDLATLTSPISGGRSVGIVSSWTKAKEF
jgi:hypothetical protein